jgi:hypothetical protein
MSDLQACHAWLTFSAMLPTKIGHEWALWPCDSVGLLTKFESTILEESSLECEEEGKQAKHMFNEHMTPHRLSPSLAPPQFKTISPLTSTSPYILFYQTIHLYYTTQREGGQPLLVWMSIQWKQFQTATKRFDSCEFNDKTTFCCVVKSIEWTSTYIRNMIKPSGECVYMVLNISFV